MITKTDIEKLPTKIRNEIAEHLKSSMDKSKKDATDSATMFVSTVDEKYRSLSLIAQGEYNAFSVLYNIFK